MVQAAIIGAGGYSGAELAAILLNHPEAELVGLFGSDKSTSAAAPGTPAAPLTLADTFPHFRNLTDLPILPTTIDAVAATGAQAVFLATPHEASHDLAPALLNRGIKVFDLSAAFRLSDAAAYPKHYGFDHLYPKLLDSAAYGLPELNRADIAAADLIAVPGCYPTSAILAIAPLVRAGAIDVSRRVIIDSISGISGAGRALKLKTLFCEVSVQPYEVLKHRHTPEIEQYCGAKVFFTPHLGPYDRGIVSTIHIDLAPKAQPWTRARIEAIYRAVYADEAFIRVLPAGTWPSVAGVRATNFCDIGFALDEPSGHLIVTSAIDNLVKGAAGQAVQCMNIRFGLPETLGLWPGGTRRVSA